MDYNRCKWRTKWLDCNIDIIMADYNSKYTGEQVEELLDMVANGEAGGGGGITVETDPVFLASPAASITDAKKEEWDNKVDKVNGKQLSTEDFTTALKTKLEGLNNYDDTELSNAIETLREDFDNIVSGDTTTAIKTFNEVIAFLEGIQDTQDLSSIIASIEQQIAAKQGAIADLETIRDGASKGATALQSIPEEYVTEDSLIWTKVEGEAGVRLKGTNGTATGNFAISAGDDKTASDGTPFASVASGDHAVAFGYGNTCSGRTTLAQGLYNIVTAKDAVAFGQRNTVKGDQAFAAGQQNEVTARLAVAIGYKNKATNTDSIAIGYQNTSSGSASVAMGDTCEASGTSSTAMGYKTKATGAYSSTFGQNTQATNEGEVAMGMYNKSTTSTDAAEQTMFSFGIGTSDTNRANALEIKKNGDVYIGDKLLSSEGGADVYITDFDYLSLESLTRSEIQSLGLDKQGLMDALAAHKVILVPYEISDDTSFKGYCTLVGYYEDFLYIKVITDYIEIIIETSLDVQYIVSQEVTKRNWADKQDALKSGENIKTINGESILGSGDIEISGGSGEVGPQGPQGEQGPKGEDGVGIASVKQTTTSSADGGTNVVTVTLSNGTTSTFNVKNGSKGSNGTNGTNGKDGADGEDGATFTPSVDSAGNLSWSNDKGLANPPTVNIKGPKGDAGSGGGSGSSEKEIVNVTNGVIEVLEPNKIYILSNTVSSLTFEIQSIAEPDGSYAEYCVIIYAESFLGGDVSQPSISLPADLRWPNGSAPDITKTGIYELNIVYSTTFMDSSFNAVLTPFQYAE